MALIKCPVCQHEVSDTADACPNCGYKMVSKTDEEALQINGENLKKKFVANLIAYIILLVVGILSIYEGATNVGSFVFILVFFGGFIVLAAVPLLIYTIVKLNPKATAESSAVNTYSKYQTFGYIIAGALLIIMGIILMFLLIYFTSLNGGANFMGIIGTVAVLATGIYTLVTGVKRIKRAS